MTALAPRGPALLRLLALLARGEGLLWVIEYPGPARIWNLPQLDRDRQEIITVERTRFLLRTNRRRQAIPQSRLAVPRSHTWRGTTGACLTSVRPPPESGQPVPSPGEGEPRTVGTCLDTSAGLAKQPHPSVETIIGQGLPISQKGI